MEDKQLIQLQTELENLKKARKQQGKQQGTNPKPTVLDGLIDSKKEKIKKLKIIIQKRPKKSKEDVPFDEFWKKSLPRSTDPPFPPKFYEQKPWPKTGKKVAKGGIIKKNTRPQMKHGGAYKGKPHSYIAGGSVKDSQLIKTK